MVRYLRFPTLTYVEPAVERRYKRLSALLFLALLGPSAWIFFGIVVESREDAALLTFVDSNMKLAGTSVTARIDRAIDPPELQVEILGRPVSDEQEEEWRKQLAFTHPHIALSVFRTSIDEADIEDLQNQVQLMMSSYGDLSAKDKELTRLRAELTLVEGEYRRLQETRLPESLGDELLATQPLASAVRWGRIAVEQRDAVGKATSTDRLVVVWTDTLSAEAKSTLEASLTEWLRIRWPAAADVDVSVESPMAEPWEMASA